MVSPKKSQGSNMNISGTGFDNNVFDEWIDTVPWLNVDLVNWVSIEPPAPAADGIKGL